MVYEGDRMDTQTEQTKKQVITLDDKIKGKSYMIDSLRFIAAALVIFSHAYAITDGGDDWLRAVSKHEITFGELSVAFFLFVSGLYVTKSLLTKQSVRGYVGGRVKRIYPLFIVVVALTAFVMGPVMTQLPVREYFSSKGVYAYLSYLVLIPNYSLPGVFTDNPMSVVNGSLWSLILEIICYGMLLVAYKLGLLDKKKMRILTILCTVCIAVIFAVKMPLLYRFVAYLRPLFCFVSGACFYVFREEIRFTWQWMTVAGIGFVICILTGCYSLAAIVFLPYFLCAGMDRKPVFLQKISVVGRYSYAMYLLGFPIQQVVYATGLGTNVWTNAGYSLLFDVVGAVILYHTIEKRF